LVTSGGLYLKETQEPFNLEREKAEPSWGDPSYRVIPVDVVQEDIAVSHLHLNTRDIEADFNILLPIHRMQELANEGQIGALADEHFAFMGYQGYPPNSRTWETEYGPEVARAFLNEGVHCVILTPA
jgi:D-proline reductase (dithiol) PrdB